jgi:hypothetical protein
MSRACCLGAVLVCVLLLSSCLVTGRGSFVDWEWNKDQWIAYATGPGFVFVSEDDQRAVLVMEMSREGEGRCLKGRALELADCFFERLDPVEVDLTAVPGGLCGSWIAEEEEIRVRVGDTVVIQGGACERHGYRFVARNAFGGLAEAFRAMRTGGEARASFESVVAFCRVRCRERAIFGPSR